MILGRNITYRYSKEPIFTETEFFVGKGEKVGIVGQNGSGKSTLFKLIMGEDQPDEGTIKVEGTVMGVPQEVKYDEQMEKARSVREYVDPKNSHEDYEIRRLLAKMELGEYDLEDKPVKMSGGQKTKLAIVRALIASPDVLLLDEPTNFLDTAGKKWVMEFLGKYPKTLLIISHDLNLLDGAIDKILEINGQKKTIDEYRGNYTEYVKLKGDKEALLVRQIHVQERHIVRMKKGWLKMSHVKSSKGVRQRLQLEKRIEGMETSLPTMPAEARKFKIKLPEPARMGAVPLMMVGINKSYGSKIVLENIDFDISRGEKIALMGPNGVGKSTLIKILMGLQAADSGEIERDEKLNIGYYSQEFETFDFDKTVIETMKEACPLPEQTLRGHLGRFLFGADKVVQKVKTLSGGEKTRLAIALLLGQNYNLLVLDEPTTYLDVLSQRLILEALKAYSGSMILVSHTPEFITELKMDRKFELPTGRWI
ncbi:MAG: ABC-F family ATP-binding cassette domain-containing protein [Microgenomates group bacterium]